MCYCLFAPTTESSAIGHGGMSYKIKLYLVGLDWNMRRIPEEFAVIVYISQSIWEGARLMLGKMVIMKTPRLLMLVVRCSHGTAR